MYVVVAVKYRVLGTEKTTLVHSSSIVIFLRHDQHCKHNSLCTYRERILLFITLFSRLLMHAGTTLNSLLSCVHHPKRGGEEQHQHQVQLTEQLQQLQRPTEGDSKSKLKTSRFSSSTENQLFSSPETTPPPSIMYNNSVAEVSGARMRQQQRSQLQPVTISQQVHQQQQEQQTNNGSVARKVKVGPTEVA